MNELISVGQVSNKGSQAGKVYSTEGLFPTVCACTHGYAIGNILEENMELIQVGSLNGKHEQSSRIYDENGICPTLMAGERKTCTGGYVSPKILIRNENELIFKGGIGDKDWVGDGKLNSRNYPQGNRIYGDEGIACSQTANGGGIGGKTGLYMAEQNINNKGDNNMWKNNLEKFNFKMEKVRLFDAFMGIGSLHKANKKLGASIEIVGSSEIEIDAIIDYAAIHIEGVKDMEFEYPTEVEMREWLIGRNIGYSFEKNKSAIPRLKKDKLYKVYRASVLLNNLGDISKIDVNNMMDFDLFNFSFSCTDLSGAGKQKGMKNEDGTPTRSGLYVYGMNIIRTKKPKYVMIENVKGLIQKKFIDDFYSIIDELKELGYNCHYPTKEDKKGDISPICLNAKSYGIPQNRDRIFVICVREDIDSSKFCFPEGFDSGIRLKDILEENVDEKYYLSQEIQDRFKLNGKEDMDRNELNQVGTTGEDKTIGQRDRTYGVNGIIANLTSTDYKQPKQILDNGAIRGRYDENGKIEQKIELRKDGTTNTITTVEKDNIVIESKNNKLNMIGMLDIKGNDQIRRVYETTGLSPTLSTMQGGNRQPKVQKDFRIRKLTPLECWRLMGFDDEDFYKAKEMGTSDSQLYKQAGNSIVVNVLYYIFKELFKEYIAE